MPTYQIGGQRLLQSDDAWLAGSLEMDTVMLLGHVSRESFVRLAALSVLNNGMSLPVPVHSMSR